MPTPVETVIEAARAFMGDRITTNATLRDHHSHGQDTQTPVLPDAVAFVETSEEAANILRLCNEAHVPVVAWGAGTSLEGHVTPVRGGITIDLSRTGPGIASWFVRPESLRLPAGVRVESLYPSQGAVQLERDRP